MALKKKLFRFAFIASAMVVLVSCGTTEKIKDVFADPIILACPDYRILSDAANSVSYTEGGGRDLTDVDVEGEITDMDLACLTKIDKETRVGVMEVEVRLAFIASRGPANRSRKARYPYFISITDLDKKILYREQFDVGVNFEGNRTKFSFRNEPITIELPLKPDLTGRNYLIYGGFVLSKQQLQLNRLRRQQRGG